MATRISVVGGSPTWRRGVVSVVSEAGYATAEAASLGAWKPGRGGRAIVLSVDGAGSFDELREFTEQYPDIPVVAVLDDLTISAFAEAVRSGAIAALDDDEPVESFATVIAAALVGRAAVPATVIRGIAARIPTVPDPS